MKFSVGTNFQDDFIAKIKKDSVAELYGKLSSDFVGGGRASYLLPEITKEKVRRHVGEAHKNGLEFNYLLNASCLDNKEYTIRGQKRLRRLLDWLLDIKVEVVTVAIPYLVEFIKSLYPQFKVSISMYAYVDTIEKFKSWENLGADIITLPPHVNRNFKLLNNIIKYKKSEVEIIPNNCCLYQCPYSLYHSNYEAHVSQDSHNLRGFAVDYCVASCSYKRIDNITENIRSPWVRPEDLDYYADIGIDRFKLIDRTRTTEKIALVVDAYTKKYYKGNLIDLLPTFQGKGRMQYNLLRKLKFFLRPFSVNIFRLKRMMNLLYEFDIYIDNQKLNGFLEYFIKHDCSSVSCQDCGYCGKIAQKVISIDPAYQARTANKLKTARDEIVSGRIFQYFSQNKEKSR